jgi:multidrug resistance efflux pump
MSEHAVHDAEAIDAANKAYIASAAAGAGSPADELVRLADLKAQGVITEEEFQKLKARAVDA